MINLRTLFLLLALAVSVVWTSPHLPASPIRTVSATVAARHLELAAYRYALAQHGKPYIWGGTGPYGYDCSGLVMSAFEAAGESLPRTTYAMLDSVRLIPESARSARRGDLAFYGSGHVEFYDVPGATYGAHDVGTKIGYTIYGAWYHPSAFYRVAVGGMSLVSLVAPSSNTRAAVTTDRGTYHVRRGDTLWSIAARQLGNALAWSGLYNANRGTIGGNPNLIYVGERLRLAVKAGAVPSLPVYRAPRVRHYTSLPASRGGTLGCAGLAALWDSAGGAPGLARTMAGIAMAESGGNQWALGDGGHSRGYWQIDDMYSNLSTYGAYGNAAGAVQIERMNGLGAWSTYTSGAWANWC